MLLCKYIVFSPLSRIFCICRRGRADLQRVRDLLPQRASPGAAPAEEAPLHVLHLRHGVRRPHAPGDAQGDPGPLVRLRAEGEEGPGGVRLLGGGAGGAQDLQQEERGRTQEAAALMVAGLLPGLQAEAAAAAGVHTEVVKITLSAVK
ncbi:hypothetical protein CEXT_99961 [Caerostris extrusa]|uniref:Uncharacterized protein n=1 Tax=Caerostris extrusa TaxID=172846 RepID=A0AAV4XIR5_CAEEX|nr:hypothetical protein CEXT_99961 [Caerostris extrusa]